MAYDEGLAQRIREIMAGQPTLVEKKMFGGLAFMVRGNMCVGITGDDLMVRVGPDGFEEALAQAHVRPMDFTGRPMKGYVYVDPLGYESDQSLKSWIDRANKFNLSLPAK